MNQLSNSTIKRIIHTAQQRARSETPRPNRLTFAIRMSLHHTYGWTPYY